jgi:hypothetical protein
MMTVQHTDQIVENPYEQYREIIREVFVRIISNSEFPVSARLFSMSCFAYETDLFMYPGSTEFCENMLAQEVNILAENVYERLWLEDVGKKSINLELPMSMIQSLLLSMIESCGHEFKEMILEAWSQYIPENHEKCDDRIVNIFEVKYSDSATKIVCSQMTGRYIKRCKHLYEVLGTKIEKQIEDFCIRFLLNVDHNGYLSLFSYMQRLVLDVVLLKYFIVSNPGMAQEVKKLRNRSGSAKNISDRERRILGKKVEDVVKHFSENATREEDSIIKLSLSLREQGMQDLAHTSILIHF